MTQFRRPPPIPGQAAPEGGRGRHEATLRKPAWGRGASIETSVQAVPVTVARIRAAVAEAEDQHRRDPDEGVLRARLETALDDASAVLDEVIRLVDQLEQYALSTPQQRYDLSTRLRAVGTARSVDWQAQTTDPARAAAARIEQALIELDPASDDVERGFEDLRSELRRLQRALRDRRRHRDDRPLTPEHLRLLAVETGRVLDTVAVGLLAGLAVALGDGSSVGDAAIAAATGAAIAPRSERLAGLVRHRLRPLHPAQRLAAAHDDLTYLIGDFARIGGVAPPERDRLEELYAAALLASAHAARSAQRLGWTASRDYAVTARQVPVVLAAAMSAARAGDTATLSTALAAVRETPAALTRSRPPPR